MSVKSKTRQARRAKAATDPQRETARKRRPATATENRAAGEIMRSLLNAITFGALEPAPESRA